MNTTAWGRKRGVERASRRWLLAFALVLSCHVAQVHDDARHPTERVCMKRALVVVSASPRLDPSRLGRRLRETLLRRELEVSALAIPHDVPLNTPVVAKRIDEFNPDGVLHVVWDESAMVKTYAYGIHVGDRQASRLHASVYKFTAERNLVEVWKSRVSAASHEYTDKMALEQAAAISESLVFKLREARIIEGCR